MRIILGAAAAAAILSGSSLLASRADAMTIAAPAGLNAAIEQTDAVEKAAYVCRRVWRFGVWHRTCWWSGPRFYRPYAFAPRARWGWRHRRW
jgi:hypothetical protein